MNTKTIETNWTELKGKIKAKWSKFSDEEVETFKTDLGLLAGKIQTAYGIAKDQAERQYDEFRKTVRTLTGEESVTGVEAAAPAAKPSLVIAPLATPVPAKQSQAV